MMRLSGNQRTEFIESTPQQYCSPLKRESLSAGRPNYLADDADKGSDCVDEILVQSVKTACRWFPITDDTRLIELSLKVS
jgi:hypothetical protein